MSLVLLNALLILAGPFLVVSPLAVAAYVQLSPPRRRPVARRFVRPSYSRWAVAW